MSGKSIAGLDGGEMIDSAGREDEGEDDDDDTAHFVREAQTEQEHDDEVERSRGAAATSAARRAPRPSPCCPAACCLPQAPGRLLGALSFFRERSRPAGRINRGREPPLLISCGLASLLHGRSLTSRRWFCLICGPVIP